MSWATALAGFIGAVVGGVASPFISGRYSRQATEQRELAARREEWWRRFTWAIELIRGEDDGPDWIGLEVLATLAASELAGAEEIALIRRITENKLLPTLVEIGAATDETGGPELYIEDAKEGDDHD